MDHFGIGNALRSLFQAHQQTCRVSGRTTSLLDSVGDKDRIVVGTGREADHLRYECKKRRLSTEIMVVPPRAPHTLLDCRPAEGRTLFEHTWVEAFYQNAIEDACKGIDELQRLASREQPAPPKTFLRYPSA